MILKACALALLRNRRLTGNINDNATWVAGYLTAFAINGCNDCSLTSEQERAIWLDGNKAGLDDNLHQAGLPPKIRTILGDWEQIFEVAHKDLMEKNP